MRIVVAIGGNALLPEDSDGSWEAQLDCARVIARQLVALRNLSGRYGPFQIAGAEARFTPDATSGPDPMRHSGEELVYVVEGEVRFTVADQVHELGPGDAIHYRTYHPHSWCNVGGAPARALWFYGRG